MNMATKIVAAKIDASRPDDTYRVMDPGVCAAQIGRMNIGAISGGRVAHTPEGVYLPVARGYWVTVHLSQDDTYIVRRVFYRSGVGKVKEEWRDVYAEQLGEVAYAASLFDN